MHKKTLMLILFLLVAVILTACGDGDDTPVATATIPAAVVTGMPPDELAPLSDLTEEATPESTDEVTPEPTAEVTLPPDEGS